MLSDVRVGGIEGVATGLLVERLELEVSDLGTDPGAGAAERFQRRRTRLRSLALQAGGETVDDRVNAVRRQLAGLGINQLSAKIGDGFISVRARASDGLAAADVSFRITLVNAGTHLRALASTVRVHGHLPTPGPVIADRILVALLGATDAPGVVDRPHARGLCDVEIDLVGGVLWQLMPPSGWRLPAVGEIELVGIRIGRGTIEVGYGPTGTRSGNLGVRPATQQLAAAHDLMHSVDQELREGHLEEAMRGYRALLAAGGPDQPLLLERILALAAARPAWFFDGIELARQALGRWPRWAAAHAALASITLAQGDAREAATHLAQLAHLASADGDDDQAALAALAGARLLRVLDPKAATALYQLALEHDPGSAEAADSLADRFVDEQRWAELVRLVRARVVITADVARAVQLRLRLADVLAHHLGDAASAQLELAAATALAPDDPAIHEMTATILASSDRPAAILAWREVARLAEARRDHRTAARAHATLGTLLALDETLPAMTDAETAWRRALAFDALQSDAIAGLARASAARNDHAAAADLYERLRGLGLHQSTAARHELELARSLVALGRPDEARSSLRRATTDGGETAAEAHAVLAEIAEATHDRDHAAAELDTAIASLVGLAADEIPSGPTTRTPNVTDPPVTQRLMTRAAQLAVSRAGLLERSGQAAAANVELQRAHDLAQAHAPEIARDAARTLLDRSTKGGDDAVSERRWIDALLATRPPPHERAQLLVRRAEVRRRERTPDLAAALADLHEAVAAIDAMGNPDDPESVMTRRRAYRLEAELLASSGDQRARAQALAALAKLAERASERIEVETAAAAAWLAADEPAAALPHGARAHAAMEEEGIAQPMMTDVPTKLRREVLVTLGEAAWRQRAWVDVIRAYKGLLVDLSSLEPGSSSNTGWRADADREGMFRYRLAVAADRTGDPQQAIEALRPLALRDGNTQSDGTSSNALIRATTPELRGLALKLFADLAERAGDLAASASALESFASLAVDSSASARADAMYRAGELFRRSAGDTHDDDAIRCLEAALRISDTHLPALDALELAWRARGDIERVSVILGRKVAATARHPQRQKPLLSRLGDLQAQLGRADVGLATHQRALEIDPMWRPSLKFVSQHLRNEGQLAAAAGGLAQLAGELPGDAGSDLPTVIRERQTAANQLAELVGQLDAGQLDSVRELAKPALERAALGFHLPGSASGPIPIAPETSQPTATGFVAASTETSIAAATRNDPSLIQNALARLRGEAVPARTGSGDAEENTQSGRISADAGAKGALSLRDAAARSRKEGKLAEAFATLETANHVNPGDKAVVRELVELAHELSDYEAAAKHLQTLAELHTGGRRGDVLLELADVYYDRIEDAQRGRTTMLAAADAFGASRRRDATLRLLASEASTHLAWDVAATALDLIDVERRSTADTVSLATALARGGRDADALAALDETLAHRPDAPVPDEIRDLRNHLRAEVQRKAALARDLEQRAAQVTATESAELRDEAKELREAIGAETEDYNDISIVVTGSASEQANAINFAAAAADRELLLGAWRRNPDDTSLYLAVLAHLGDREPALKKTILEEASRQAKGRTQALALHALGEVARSNRDPVKAASMWSRAHAADPELANVWMPLADALAAADDTIAARELYERVAGSPEYPDDRRQWAAARAEALGKDDTIVSGEIASKIPGIARAQQRLDEGDVAGAIAAAEAAAASDDENEDLAALEMLERLYLQTDDLTAASEAIGRQLAIVEDQAARATLWKRRARLYRNSQGKDGEVYRCLKEAHACAPADPEIAYQLRISAMVRSEWALAASLLYREIASAPTPRDRGALHLELALIYDEKLDDPDQAQVNYEQALAFDPTIPAAKLPLAKRYEAQGRMLDAARLYDEAAPIARPIDRASIVEAAARCRDAAAKAAPETDLATKLECAEAAGDLDAARELAHQLWKDEPGNALAFRTLAIAHHGTGDLAALTEITTVRATHADAAEERARIWLDVAQLADEVGQLEQAARAYDLALIEDPGHINALDARGGLAFRQGDYATADMIYRDLGTGESLLGDDELANRRSIIAEKLHRDDEALALARQAVASAPGRRDFVLRVQELATRLGDLETAIGAARVALDLVPLEDHEGRLAAHFALVGLLREVGDLERATTHLEHIVRDHPHETRALEALADIAIVQGDWGAATRYLYQLVPLAPTVAERADRLYELGEVVLVHLGDVDRADDVFLRASDLDPTHVPTLRRLLDVYWRADDPGSLVEVATELAQHDAFTKGQKIAESSLAHAFIAAALVGDTDLAGRLARALGEGAPAHVAAALGELVNRDGRLQLASASTAIAELGRRGLFDLAKLRDAADGTPAGAALGAV